MSGTRPDLDKQAISPMLDIPNLKQHDQKKEKNGKNASCNNKRFKTPTLNAKL
jgi:hypothetical protein